MQHNKDSIKEYRAILNQEGAEDPVATVLMNTLGVDITWQRAAAGIYTGVLGAGQILPALQVTMGLLGPSDISISALSTYMTSRVNDESLIIQTGTPSEPGGADGLLVNSGFELKIYNQYQ